MLLAVLSDTHLGKTNSRFERIYDEFLAPADTVLHCGDIVSPSVLHHLMMHPDLKAVAGNMDSWTTREMLTDTISFEAEGFTIGAAHGWGSARGLAERVAAAFGPGYDLICFGHSHIFQHTVVNGVHVVNPGSACQSRSGPPSLAHITLERGEPIRVKKIELGT